MNSVNENVINLQAAFSSPAGFLGDFPGPFGSCGSQSGTSDIGIFPSSSGFQGAMPSDTSYSTDDIPSDIFQGGFDASSFQNIQQTYPESYSYEGAFMVEKESAKQLGAMYSAESQSFSGSQSKYTDAMMSYEGSFQAFPAQECDLIPQRYSSDSKQKFTYPSTHELFQTHHPGFSDLDQKHQSFPSHSSYSEASSIFCRERSSFPSYSQGFYDNRNIPHTESISDRGHFRQSDLSAGRQGFTRRPPLTIPMPPGTPEG